MKKSKIIIAAFLVCSCLVIGVGYATLSKTLTVNGSAAASAKADNFTVVFSEAKNESNCTVTGEGTETVGLTVTAGALTTKDDTASATLVVKNTSSELKAAIPAFTVNAADSEYFEVTVANPSTAPTLDPNGTTEITVTVKLKKTPSTDVAAFSFTVTANATAVEA